MSLIKINDIIEKGHDVVHGEIVPQRWSCDLCNFDSTKYPTIAAHLHVTFADCFRNDVILHCVQYPTNIRLGHLFCKVVL